MKYLSCSKKASTVLLECIFCIIVFSVSIVQGQSQKVDDIRVLISRPNSYDYTVNQKTVWISPVIEKYLYLMVDAIDRVTLLSPEKISPFVYQYQEYNERVSKAKYIDAGRELLAHYVVYSEYTLNQSGKTIELHLSVESVKDDKTLIREVIEIPFADLDSKNIDIVQIIAKGLELTSDEVPTNAVSNPLLGKSFKQVEHIGQILLPTPASDKKNIIKSAENCEKITLSHSKEYGIVALYCASYLYSLAGVYDKALSTLNQLSTKFGSSYPKMYIQLARLSRISGNYTKAQEYLSQIQSNERLETSVLLESALISIGMGEFESALSSLQGIAEQQNSPIAYVYMAKAAIGMKKNSEASDYSTKASELSGKSIDRIYLEIGDEFYKDGDKKNAIAAYKQSLAIDKQNPVAWQKIGTIQEESGLDSAAAISYFNVFMLDCIQYANFLDKAGNLLAKKQLNRLALKIYSLAFEKVTDPKIAISLAGLYFNEGNYSKTRDIISKLSYPWDKDERVEKMMAKMATDKIPPELTLAGSDTVYLDLGGVFEEPGYSAVEEGFGDLTNSVRVSGTVVSEKPGTYELVYSVTGNRKGITRKTRYVVVQGTVVPQITLKGSRFVNLVVGDSYKEAGATCKDIANNDFSSQIEVAGEVQTQTPGIYPVVYSYTDASGTTVMTQRNVNVRDPNVPSDGKSPTIQLIGKIPKMLFVGDTFEEPSVNASDDVDGDITGYVIISGEVSTNKIGNYTITYAIADRSGNETEKSINVVVKQKKIAFDGPKKKPSSSAGAIFNNRFTSKTNISKWALSITTFLIGAGAGYYAYYADNVILPRVQKEYSSEGEPSNIAAKKKALIQAKQMRDGAMLGSGIFGLVFTMNIIIP